MIVFVIQRLPIKKGDANYRKHLLVLSAQYNRYQDVKESALKLLEIDPNMVIMDRPVQKILAEAEEMLMKE